MTNATRATIWCTEIRRVINKGKHPEIAIQDAQTRIKASRVMTFIDRSRGETR